MTSEQIERTVEHQMDALDRRLIGSDYTQTEYDAAVRKLDAWAEAQYARAA